ncbi:hypothetical protein ACE1SV_69650 [Streptomyces sennicomposti]
MVRGVAGRRLVRGVADRRLVRDVADRRLVGARGGGFAATFVIRSGVVEAAPGAAPRLPGDPAIR